MCGMQNRVACRIVSHTRKGMPSANGWHVKRHKKYWGRFCLLRPFSIPGFDKTFQPCFVPDARTTSLSGSLQIGQSAIYRYYPSDSGFVLHSTTCLITFHLFFQLFFQRSVPFSFKDLPLAATGDPAQRVLLESTMFKECTGYPSTRSYVPGATYVQER